MFALSRSVFASLAGLFLIVMLSSCGGGGGGGGSGPSFSLTGTSVTLTAIHNGSAPAPQDIGISVSGGAVYVAVLYSGPYTSAQFYITGSNTGTIQVSASSTSMAIGSYKETVVVHGCKVFDCSTGEVSGSPKVINVTYNVTWPSGSVGSSCSGSTSSTGKSGSLDTNFCGTGHMVFDSIFHVTSDDGGNAIKLDSNGNILVGGYTTNADGNYDTALWRYTSTGAMDTGFGTDFDSDGSKEGLATYDGATGSFRNDVINAVTVDASGHILVAGSTDNGSGTLQMLVMRYNSDGSLDTSFATGGRFKILGTAGGSGGDVARGIAIDGSGNIVVAGSSMNAAGNYDMAVWHLLGNGTLDTTFGGDYDSSGTPDGFVIHDNAAGGNANDFGNAVLIDGSGRILVAGSSTKDNSTSPGVVDMVVWRFTSAGVLDTTFGGDYNNDSMPDGYFLHNGASGTDSYDAAVALALDSNQRIVVTGSSFSTSTDYKLVVWRLTADGVLDTSFGTNGYAKWGSNGSWDVGQAVAVDASNRVIVAGGRSNDLVVLRYTSAGALDSSFGTGGATFFTDGAARAVTLKPTGEILVAGSYYNGSDYDMALWQYVP